MPHQLTRSEYDRKFRVLDTMLTGHSLLRDRYDRRSLFLTVLILGLSIAATSAAFLGGERPFTILSVTARVQTWVGLLAALVFFLTLVELRTDWRQRARSHGDAARRLGELKGRFRSGTVSSETVQTELDLSSEYEQTMAALPAIPDRQFLGLKAKHRRKIEVSKLIDQHPGALLPYLRLLAVIHGIPDRTGAGRTDDAPPEAE
jgi:hypothetical protein